MSGGRQTPPPSLRDSGRLAVEWSRLRLSVGDVAPVEVTELTRTDDNVLKVKFASGAGDRFDHVYLYAFCPDQEKGFLSAPAYRQDKRLTLLLPDLFAGHEVHVYLMVASRDGRWSHSVYAGVVAEGEVIGKNNGGERKADVGPLDELAEEVVLERPGDSDVDKGAGG